MKTHGPALWVGALLLVAILFFPLGTSSAFVPAPKPSGDAPGGTMSQGTDRFSLPTDQIIVRYKASASLLGGSSPASAAEIKRLSDAAGVPLTYSRAMSGDAHVLRLASRQPLNDVQIMANRLSLLPEVEYAEPDAIMVPMLTPNDPNYPNQWHYFAPGSGHYGINAPAAWDITTGSASIVVADVDTGITNHVDLAGRTVPGYDFIADALVANDGDGRDSDPSDPGDWITAAESASGYFAGCPVENSSWHGTHTAGTIGAASNNGVGVAGVNWNSKILPVRVLGKCGGYISDIIDGMRWAAGLAVSGVPNNTHPAKVINMSLGGKGACTADYQNAINAVIAAGTTIVVSAGNSNDDASGYRPANCNGVITVAATNRDGSRAYYSNYGSVVEISAPGGAQAGPNDPNGVLSTLNTGTQGPVADTYVYYQGTSMAAPHITGIVSLLYSLNPSLTPAQILTILQNTVTHFPAGSTCNTSICGSGIANAGSAVASIGQGTATPTPTVTRTPTRTTTPTKTTTPKPFTPTVFIRLPLVLHNYPPLPPAPGLNAIANADGDGNYTVSWSVSSGATSYLLQEDDNAGFSSPSAAYSGAAVSWNATSKPAGTYYYRVRAINAWGVSPWSNVVSTVVQPTTGPNPGFWQQSGGAVEFYVTADRQNVDDFAVYVNVSGCGSYKITHTVPVAISGSNFSFSGAFSAAGAFSSNTAASGTTRLTNFYISGCGYVNGGPWAWNTTWQHAAQASAQPSGDADGNAVEPLTGNVGVQTLPVP